MGFLECSYCFQCVLPIQCRHRLYFLLKKQGSHIVICLRGRLSMLSLVIVRHVLLFRKVGHIIGQSGAPYASCTIFLGPIIL